MDRSVGRPWLNGDVQRIALGRECLRLVEHVDKVPLQDEREGR